MLKVRRCPRKEPRVTSTLKVQVEEEVLTEKTQNLPLFNISKHRVSYWILNTLLRWPNLPWKLIFCLKYHFRYSSHIFQSFLPLPPPTSHYLQAEFAFWGLWRKPIKYLWYMYKRLTRPYQLKEAEEIQRWNLEKNEFNII